MHHRGGGLTSDMTCRFGGGLETRAIIDTGESAGVGGGLELGLGLELGFELGLGLLVLGLCCWVVDGWPAVVVVW